MCLLLRLGLLGVGVDHCSLLPFAFIRFMLSRSTFRALPQDNEGREILTGALLCRDVQICRGCAGVKHIWLKSDSQYTVGTAGRSNPL